MTLLVSDEADLLEANLDFHLDRGVDFVVVTANRSSEEIIETLRRYVEAGAATVILEPAQTYAQSEWVTRMARLAATEHRADWVINSDVDEFYWPEGGNLKEIFSAIPAEYGSLIMPVCHFVPRPEEDGFFARRMTVRETVSGRLTEGRQFAKTAHRASAEARIGRGNHKVKGTDFETVPAWRPILGLHFPLRSFSQYERKVIKDGEAAANNPNSKISDGVWRRLLDLHAAGRLPEEYAQRVYDDERVRDGIRLGQLVVDERLKHFFEARPSGAPNTPAPVDHEVVERLRIDLRRTIYEAQVHPLAVEAAQVALRLEKAESKLANSARALDKAQRKLARSERRRSELKAKLRAARLDDGGVAGSSSPRAWRRLLRALSRRRDRSAIKTK